MKVLHLTLKKKWFDMIASGEKKEEYREIKPYWTSRFWVRDEFIGLDGGYFKDFDVVEFKNGYSKNALKLRVECLGISEGMGLMVWGAPKDKEVFIISLGKSIL